MTAESTRAASSQEARAGLVERFTVPFALVASASVHLGEIDFEALARYFAKTQNKASAVLALTSATVKRAESLVRLNPTRRSLREQLEQLIRKRR